MIDIKKCKAHGTPYLIKNMAEKELEKMANQPGEFIITGKVSKCFVNHNLGTEPITKSDLIQLLKAL